MTAATATRTLIGTNGVTAPEGTVLVKVGSHRARAKMQRITGNIRSYFSWNVEGEWFFVPAEQAEAVLAITGISKARMRTDLHKCLSFR